MPILPSISTLVFVNRDRVTDFLLVLSQELSQLRTELAESAQTDKSASPSLERWDRITQARDGVLYTYHYDLANMSPEAKKVLAEYETLRKYVMSDVKDRDVDAVLLHPLRQSKIQQACEDIRSLLDRQDFAGIRSVLDKLDADPLFASEGNDRDKNITPPTDVDFQDGMVTRGGDGYVLMNGDANSDDSDDSNDSNDSDDSDDSDDTDAKNDDVTSGDDKTASNTSVATQTRTTKPTSTRATKSKKVTSTDKK